MTTTPSYRRDKIMRCSGIISLLCVGVAIGCGDDDSPAGTLAFQYSLQPPAEAVSVGQDSTVALDIKLLRGTDEIEDPRLLYSSSDVEIARVDSDGEVTGLSGGTAVITVSGPTTTLDVPVEVRPHTATSVELSVMSGPAGSLLATTLDTGTFYALPAHPATARLRALVRVGSDTVFCNYCATTDPARVLRLVRFTSLDPTLATVSNATDPTVQTGTGGTNNTGQVTALDTNSNGARIVLEVPGDDMADTVTVKLKLRPIDTVRVRPDSAFFPSNNGLQGLVYRIWPFSDNTQANITQSATTNFNAGVTFLSRVQPLPSFGSSTPSSTLIPITPLGSATERRPNLPLIGWESANVQYLTINAAGAVVGPCAFIGGNCPSTGSTVLNCDSVAGSMPAVFAGLGTYAIPNCVGKDPIPMPGAFCTSTSSSDLTSVCTIWIRATFTDQATASVERSIYRINVRR
jgi:hypothetical protein